MKKKIFILLFFISLGLIFLLYLFSIVDKVDVPFPDMPEFVWKDENYVEEYIEPRDPIEVNEPFDEWEIRIDDKIMGLKVYEYYVDKEVTSIRMEGALTLTGRLYTELLGFDIITLRFKPDEESLEKLPKSIYDEREEYTIFMENGYDYIENIKSDIGVTDDIFEIDNVEVIIEDFLFIKSDADPSNRAILKDLKIINN